MASERQPRTAASSLAGGAVPSVETAGLLGPCLFFQPTFCSPALNILAFIISPTPINLCFISISCWLSFMCEQSFWESAARPQQGLAGPQCGSEACCKGEVLRPHAQC